MHEVADENYDEMPICQSCIQLCTFKTPLPQRLPTLVQWILLNEKDIFMQEFDW